MTFIKLLFVIALVIPLAVFMIYYINKLINEFAVISKRENEPREITEEKRRNEQQEEMLKAGRPVRHENVGTAGAESAASHTYGSEHYRNSRIRQDYLRSIRKSRGDEPSEEIRERSGKRPASKRKRRKERKMRKRK